MAKQSFTEILDMPVRLGGASLFHNIFFDWWDLLKLSGRGLVVGTPQEKGNRQKNVIAHRYEGVTEVLCLDLQDADIRHDITNPLPKDVGIFDWMVCQAMLEHVVDPVGALRSMFDRIRNGGSLYLHSHGPQFGYHQHPIDCYRFHRDVLIAWADLFKVIIIDMWWSSQHFFVVYKKER